MTQPRKRNGHAPASQSRAPKSEMPIPGAKGTAEEAASAEQSSDMPTPKMGSGAARDDMPRPGGAFTTTTGRADTTAADLTPREMPIPSFASAVRATAEHSSPGAGPGLPRFVLPGGGRPTPSFEPGVVEVLFREGVSPSVIPGDTTSPGAVRSPSAPLAEVNRILQRYRVQSIEPTFLLTHEAATSAQTVARDQGIDVPHLAHFVTFRFPADSDVQAIAEELSGLAEVEKAVPIPTALPPNVSLAAPSRMAPSLIPEEDVLLEEAPVEGALPAGNPLAEPLTGNSTTVVVNPATGLENQWYIIRCNVNAAWARSTGKNVVIADVDWGCRVTHEDLAPDIEKTYNAYDGTTNVNQGGSMFHGTGVLGLTGASVNGKGLSGVAYEATLWPVQADSGAGPALGGNAWARGIDWVRTTNSGGKRKVAILEVQTGAFGNYEQVPSVNAAIKTAIASGVVVCVAAGNGDRDAGIDDSGQAIPETGSILVGATGYSATQNARAWFSNYGPRITVSAPGDSNHDVTCNSASNTSYRNDFGGTSGATPKVAGVAALVLGANPSLTHEQIRTILRTTGGAVVTDASKPVGTFLNADAAVQRAAIGAVGRLEVFARGSDRAVWHLWQTAPNNGWSGWASMGGSVDIIQSARNADGRLELFVRGVDGAVWHKWMTAPNNGWSGWASMGGWVDLISVAKNLDGRLELFARGGDGAVWHNWQTAPNNGWSGWASMGGWIDRIVVGQNADGRLELFARGADGAVWHNWQTAPNNGWSGWASLGGWVDLLQVGRNADGRLELFARGADGALWHKWQTAPNNGWSGWASLGGWIDRIAVASNADGRVEVFARGGDQAVWHMWQTAPNNGWSAWSSMGGWVDILSVNQNADGRLELFVRGLDRAVWHKWQTAPSNGWSGWASMGGWVDLITVDQNAA
jgi:subtilisin family serine protease